MKEPKLNGKPLKKMYFEQPKMTATLGVLGVVGVVMLAAVVNGIKQDIKDEKENCNVHARNS